MELSSSTDFTPSTHSMETLMTPRTVLDVVVEKRHFFRKRE
jgi:hypothetical protein